MPESVISSFFFQQFHHVANHGSLFVAQRGDIQEALVLAAQQIIHRDAEHIGQPDQNVVRRKADICFIGRNHGRRNPDQLGHLRLSEVFILAELLQSLGKITICATILFL